MELKFLYSKNPLKIISLLLLFPILISLTSIREFYIHADPTDGVYTFKNATDNSDGTFSTVDGFFIISAFNGSSGVSTGSVAADEYGAFINDGANNTFGTSYIEVAATGAGNFNITDAVIGDYNPSSNSTGNDFINVYAVGYFNENQVAITPEHNSGGIYEGDYELDFSDFYGKTLNSLRVYYTWDLGTTQSSFNLESIEIKQASSNAAPSFNDGTLTTLSVDEGSGANIINDLLDITDTNTGDNLTWSINSIPIHGSLGGFNTTATSNGGAVTPSDLTYTPTIGYIGADSFTIQVSDGTDTDLITVDVTVKVAAEPNSLNAGDIAIIGFNSDISPDEMAIVTLAEIPAGTTIYISDYGWNGSSLETSSSIDGIITWETTANVEAGTVIKIEVSAPAGAPIIGGTLSDYGTVSASGWTNINSAVVSGGDNWFIYQGNTSTVPTNWIFGFANWSASSSNPGEWMTGGSISSTTSYLPSGLVNGTNAIALTTTTYHRDNMVYTGIQSGSKTTLLSSICTIENWIGDENSPYDISAGGTEFSGTNPIFNLGGATNTAPTATSVSFSGTLETGKILSGNYDWSDADSGDTESGSSYKWYRADDNSGTNKAAISGAATSSYTLVNADIGKSISFEVTPNDGTLAGAPVESSFQGPVISSNTPPAVNTNGGLTVTENQTATIDSGKLHASDDEDSSDSQLLFTITQAIANGTLFIDSNPNNIFDSGDTELILNASFTQDDINNGKIKYSSTTDNDISDAFEFTLSDSDGGNLTGQTFSITITPINDAPVASSITFSGTLKEGQQLTGSYAYSDAEGDDESGSSYKWYLADDNSGTNKAAISGATSSSYTLVNVDIGKFISLEVTPNDGTLTGAPAESSFQGPIVADCNLTASISAQTNIACNGGSTGALTVTASGGTANYKYVWNNGSTTSATTSVTNTISDLPAGTYEVTVTDANGCTATATATITQPAALSMTPASQTNIACNGGATGAATVNATGGTAPYTYNWAPGNPTGDGTTSVSGLTAGTWTVTATDANGCTATQSFTITQPTVLSANAVAGNVSCNGGNNGTVDLTVTGGTAPYSYAWNNSATTEDMIGLTAATYSVTVTDANGCTATTSVNVLEPAVLSANTVAGNVSCNGGNNGTVDLTVTGGTAPYTYAWNNSATTEDMIGLTAETYSVTVTDANGCTATTSVNVLEPAVLSANTVAGNVSCNGGNNGTVDLTVTGGTAPYTYLWSNAATTASIAGVAAGTYDVTITDANGCTATASVTVTQPTALSANAVSTNVSCNGGTNGTIDLTVTGGTAPYSYEWNTAVTTEDRIGLSAGTYDVAITDANGCTATASATITEPTVLVAFAVVDANVSCNSGNDGAATVNVSGGTAPYTYLWSNTATTASIAGVSAGTYDVTITDANGCTATASVTVTQPTALSANAVSGNVSCNSGNDGAATVNVSGGTAPYTYLWNNAATTASIAGVAAGTYDVTVTDANGCTATASVTVTQPTALSANAVSGNVSCNGGNDGAATVNVSGGTTPYTYLWNNAATSASIAGVAAGTYNVTVTDANGCTATASVTVTQPTALSANAVSGNVSCNGGNDGAGTVNVSGGTAPYTYLWSNAATTASIAGVAAGTYNVTVTDANGCTATASVTVTQPTALSSNAVSTNVSCNSGNDGAATVSVSGGTAPYTYLWNNAATTASIAGVAAGTYNVTVTDANGCTANASVTITQPTVLIAGGVVNANVSCNSGNDGAATVNVSGGTAPYTYLWSNAATTASIAGVAAGTYNVTVTDANSCTATASVTIIQPTALSSNAVSGNVSCNGGNDGAATVNVSGGTAPYTYLWSNAATTASIAGVAAGTYNVTVTDANGCTANASVTITQPTVLIAGGVVNANVSCNSGNDGAATVNVSGGTAPYTYLWSNAATTASIAGVAAGTYNVTVTDANGCTATSSATITEPTALTASAVATNVSCNGESNGTIDLTVTGGTAPYSYEWNTAVTTEDRIGLSAGTYDVTITDANGCTATASATITEPTALVASAVVDAHVSCNAAADGAATVTVTGGTAPYTYLWSNAATTASIAGVAAGTYSVTMTDANGCSATASVTLEIVDVTFPVAISKNITVELDANGQASITAADIDNGSSDNCSIVNMEVDQTDFSCATLGENTVTLTVTDASGNKSMTTAVVTVTGCILDNISLADETVTYDGTAHLLKVNGLPTGATVTYGNNSHIEAGTYNVTATVSKQYYNDLELTATLIIKKAAQVITLNPIPLKHLEKDADFQLEATATSGLPVTYTYSYEGNEAPATVSASGYVVLLTSGVVQVTALQEGGANYLPAQSVTRVLTIDSDDAYVHSLAINDQMYSEPDSSIYYLIDCEDVNSKMHVWVDTETNASVYPAREFDIIAPVPGIYYQDINVVSQNGAMTEIYHITVEKRFNFEDIVVQKFNNVLLVNNNPETNGGYVFVDYQWFKDGKLIGNSQYYSAGENSEDTLDPNAMYQVKMTTADGEILQTCAAQIQLKESFEMKAYPNPVVSGGSFQLLADLPQEELKHLQITMYNLYGVTLKTVQATGNITTVQLPSLPSGAYMVIAKTPEREKTFKIIIK